MLKRLPEKVEYRGGSNVGPKIKHEIKGEIARNTIDNDSAYWYITTTPLVCCF